MRIVVHGWPTCIKSDGTRRARDGLEFRKLTSERVVDVYGGHVAIISARASDGFLTTVNSCCDVRDKSRVMSVGVFGDLIYIHNALTTPHTIAQEKSKLCRSYARGRR